MDVTATPVRILVIRSWIEPLAPIRAAMREAAIDAHITRVDIEPALNAALSRSRFDIVLFDPSTPDLSLDIVEARLRDHRVIAPIVTLSSLDKLADALQAGLLSRLN
jgi:DNA-binding response OmpR family regulator